jgi:hypothetical protein
VAGGFGVASVVFAIMRRISGAWMAQLALRKPPCRPVLTPESRTGGRNLPLHSQTSRWVVRGRALPGWRDVNVTLWSWSETIRRLALATLQTDGARDGQAVAPCGVPWLGTFQGGARPGGPSVRPARR